MVAPTIDRPRSFPFFTIKRRSWHIWTVSAVGVAVAIVGVVGM